ncbi:major capsid protein P2 [Vibrio sp. Of7-15]|uniref:major capsid protein P2 n=1 Tax=Vibrio sp. Of7-15 TaxID=2724879 RepID=UPI001EF25271|nr:major capsid protein P2 [Vibrio sp. Of7-15]MCG7500044.1 major capsid protein P2 [Vibrio sp. Of7-15]
MSTVPMKLNSFNGIGWNQKATLTISVGPTYEEILLETNLEASQVKRVAVVLNGEEIYIMTGLELLMLETYKRRDDIKEQEMGDGFLVIPFSDITGKTKNGVRSSALVTEAGDNITLEIEIGDQDTESDVTHPSIQGWATVSPKQPERLVIPRIRPETMQATSTENEFLNLVSGDNVYIRRMHFEYGRIKNVSVFRDFVKVYECSTKLCFALAARNTRGAWKQTPIDCFHFDPTMRGFYINELFSTAHKSELKFSVETEEAPGSIRILVESLEVLPVAQKTLKE